jgi:hypothetical protein
MSANFLDTGRPSLGEQARPIVRLNGYASLLWAVPLLSIVWLVSGSFGPIRIAVTGVVLGILAIGLLEISLSLGRRFRRGQILPVVALNATSAIACIALALAKPSLPLIASIGLIAAAGTFAWFAIAEARAARSL